MQLWLTVLLVILALFIIRAVMLNSYANSDDVNRGPTLSPHPGVDGHVICHVIEYQNPPNDSKHPPTEEENLALQEAAGIEGLRGGGGRGGGGRGGGGRGGGGRGGGGRGGGGRRHGGGLPRWPWRTWPIRSGYRPWRNNLWQYYPNYIPTYPLTYYTTDWVQPVQRFTVRIGPKSDGNVFKGVGSDLGYMITSGTGQLTQCGTSGARLDLQRGQTYEFDIYTLKDCVTGQDRDQPFFFTTNPEGGSEDGKLFNINPVRNGTVRVEITGNLPSQFYYQSTTDKNVGGHVFLH